MEARAETVSVRLARSSERHLIENLSQFYIYDFSKMEPPGSDKMDFADQGHYSGLSDLNSYWRRKLPGGWASRCKLLICNNRILAQLGKFP